MLGALGANVLVIAVENLTLNVRLQAFVHVLLSLDLTLEGKKALLSFRDVWTLEGLNLLGQFPAKEITKEDFLGYERKSERRRRINGVGSEG